MKLLGKDLKKEILYIAEIGVNHEGSIPRCLKLIKDFHLLSSKLPQEKF